MMRSRFLLLATLMAASLGLAACGEQPQEMTGQGIKDDNPPHQGVGSSQYANSSWKPGDRTSWEQQLKTRAQYGQNDYNRIAN